MRIKASGLCSAFYGSVRAFIDSDPSRDFGFLYLDYCCSLAAGKCCLPHESNATEPKIPGLCSRPRCRELLGPNINLSPGPSAGKFHVEKSPVLDIEQLFRNRQCDLAGCIMCVCLATVDDTTKKRGADAGSDDDSSGEEGDEELREEREEYSIPSIEEGRGQGDPQRLRCLITSRAAMAGMVAVCLPTSFWWPGNYAEVGATLSNLLA